jgi:hypothetical protein
VKIDPEKAVLFLQASVKLRVKAYGILKSQERREEYVCTSPERTQFPNPLCFAGYIYIYIHIYFILCLGFEAAKILWFSSFAFVKYSIRLK